MRAIETRYKGYRFRSRLEARWAVFFDALGNRWEYEPETLLAGDRAYLPDFLVESRLFVEIKPQHLLDDESTTGGAEVKRWTAASQAAGFPLLVIFGPPSVPTNNNQLIGEWGIQEGAWLVDLDLGCCRKCGGFAYSGSDSFATPLCRAGCDSDRWPCVTDHYRAAVTAARSARFEWGELGAPKDLIVRVQPDVLDPNDPLYSLKLRMREINAAIPLAEGEEKDRLVREKSVLYAQIKAHEPLRWRSR